MGRGIGRRGRGGGTGRGRGSGQGSFSASFHPDQDFNKQAKQAGEVMPSSEQELDALKAQALAMKQKLRAINERIAKIEGGSLFPHPVAVVNAEKCTACGLCEGICPVSAVKIDNVAIIDSTMCTGCGQCVAECPRDAITLKKA
jgi:ferredoxin